MKEWRQFQSKLHLVSLATRWIETPLENLQGLCSSRFFSQHLKSTCIEDLPVLSSFMYQRAKREVSLRNKKQVLSVKITTDTH